MTIFTRRIVFYVSLKRFLLREGTYESLRKAYLTAFIAAVFTRVLLPFAICETQFVNSLVFAIVALFGAAVVGLDVFTRRVFLTAKNVGWLAAFLLVCAISSAINAKYGIIGNVRNLVWLAISFFLLYTIDPKRTIDSVKKEIKYVGNILIAVCFLACGASLVMFALQVGYYVDVYPDSFARMGFIEGRLFGVFEDPNYAAVVAMIAIIYSIFNLKNTEKKWLKAFYVCGICVDFCYIVLSGSRTTEVAAIIVVFLAAYFLLLKKLNTTKFNKPFLRISIILVAILCSAVLIFSFLFARKALAYLPDVVGAPFKSVSVAEQKPRRHIDITRDDVSNSADISNCRFKIWLSALELFKSKPIFGVSPRNMRTYAKAAFPKGFIAQRSYAVHNAYLDVLTSTGLLGAVLISIFLVKYLISVFQFLFVNLNNKNFTLVLFGFLNVATVAISAFFLSEIFFVNTIGVLTFWMNLGYSYHFSNKSAAQENAGGTV